MKKLDSKKLKLLKLAHLLFAIMWIGGVLALITIQLGTNPTTIEMAYLSAQDQLIIDKLFLIPGGIGIAVTAVVYGIFTNYRFFRQKWIAAKWIFTVILIAIGAGYMGVLVKSNAEYTTQALLNHVIDFELYWHNVHCVAIAGIIQLVLFAIVLILSVWKPKKLLPSREKE